MARFYFAGEFERVLKSRLLQEGRSLSDILKDTPSSESKNMAADCITAVGTSLESVVDNIGRRNTLIAYLRAHYRAIDAPTQDVGDEQCCQTGSGMAKSSRM